MQAKRTRDPEIPPTEPAVHARRAVVRVGEGRGVVMELRRVRVGGIVVTDRVILTAAHCLPALPPPDPNLYHEECTYPDLVGEIDRTGKSITARCAFVDPCADVAVLVAPDNQTFTDEADAYEDFACGRPALALCASPASVAWVFLLSLDGRWNRAKVVRNEFHLANAGLYLVPSEPIIGGMSGSPIVAESGAVVGLVSNSANSEVPDEVGHGPQPCLAHDLPQWAVRGLSKRSRRGGAR